jgi:hypothetical protein
MMKGTGFLISVFCLLTTVLAAGTYSQQDRDSALAELDNSRIALSVALESVTQKQSEFRSDSGTWSILQVTEHLVLAESFLFGLMKQLLDQTKPVPDEEKLPDPREMDHLIVTRVPDRSQKAKAPEQATPKDAYRNRDEAFTEFSQRRLKTMEFVRETKLDLRRYRGPSPIGPMDAHQWVLMIAAHTNRHIQQIEELKRHELFPKE